MPAPPGGERRQLTVMFCDLAGSTALSARLDPEDLREVLAAYQRTVSDLVARAGGIVARQIGDGILVYFGYPAAQENDVEQAIGAALQITQAIGGLSRAAIPMAVRVGIATGEVVVNEMSAAAETDRPAIVGTTPNLASRLQDLASSGGIVIADETRRLAGDLFLYRDMGAHTLKGFPSAHRAWEVTGRSAIESRFVALRPSRRELIGRAADIESLMRCWQLAKSGQGQVVLVSGEPGIGKSRLVAALDERLGAEARTEVRLFCSPQHRDSPLHPSIAHLRRMAGFGRADSDTDKIAKLEALLSRESGVEGDDFAILAALLGLTGETAGGGDAPLDPKARRDLTLAALVRQLDFLARRNPVLAVYEDVHWSDPTSRELLDILVARAAASRILTVVTARPEFQPAWIGRPHVQVMIPRRLARIEAGQLVTQIVGGRPVPARIVDNIVARADGVPLFVEELTKAYLDESDRPRDGAYEGARVTSSAPAVPVGLQALLMARLDRLGPAKELAQIAAAIGRDFSHDLLAAAWGRPEDELRAAIGRLMDVEVISRRAIGPGAAYLFRHALIQDAATASLLRGQRQAIHARITDALAARFPEVAEQQPELIAHHAAAAGRAEQAARQWLRAGQRTARRGAVAEAVAHFKRGIGAIGHWAVSPGPACRDRERCALELYMGLGPALMAWHGYASDEGLAAFQHARVLLPAARSPAERQHVLHGLFNVHYGRAELVEALAVAGQADAMADHEEQGLPGAIGQTLCAMGRFSEARGYLERAVAIADDTRDAHSGLFGSRYVVALSFLAKVSFAQGYPEMSARLTRDAVTSARASGHPVSIAIAQMGEMFIATEGADFKLARSLTEQALAHASDHDLGNFKLWAAFHLAALMIREDPRAAIAAMQEVLRQAEQVGTWIFRPTQLGTLGAAYAAVGAFDEALALFGEGLDLAETTQGREATPALYRMRGRTLLALRRQAAAEDDLETAISVARRQGARIEALRAATLLARYWHEQGRPQEACDVLAGIYAQFTQGFAFTDVRQARQTLETLRAWCDRQAFV